MLAVARIEADGQQLGTAFAVSGDRALTAFHCVGDRQTGEVEHGRVELHFHSADPVSGRFLDGDGRLDFAVLALEAPLPDGVEPIPLVRRAVPNEGYRALGHPAVAEEVGQWAVSGHVTNPDARLPGDVPAIQLVCREAAAGLELPGLSGGPVLVGTPEAAVGLVRWNLEDASGLALGGSFFAAPCEEMIARVQELGAAVVERRAGPPPRDADSFAAWAAGEFAVQMAREQAMTVDEAERHYVEVLVRTRPDRDGKVHEAPLSALAADPRSRLMVVGEGGAGKTTMLLRLAWTAAEQSRDAPPGGGPFFARLNLVEAGGGRTFESLLALLGEPVGLSGEQLHDAWLQGHRELLFLVDGLNEVANDAQPSVEAALRRLLGERRHRYVITTRPTAGAERFLAEVPDLAAAYVVRLGEEQVQEYLAGHGVDGLYDQLGDRLKGLSGNPFMLWAIVQACSGLERSVLPSNVGSLYRQFVDDYVFGKREPAKQPSPTRYDYAGVKRRALAAIAADMTVAGTTRVAVDDALVDRLVTVLEEAEHEARRRRKVMPDDWTVDDFLQEVLHNGIVVADGSTLAFMHESVQEYFSAVALRDEQVADVVERLPELLWRFVPDDAGGDGFEPTPLCQVVVMLAGIVVDATPLLRALQGRNPLLAARCLGAASAVDPALRRDLVHAWCGLISRRDDRYRVVGCRCLAAARATDPEATAALLARSADASAYKASSAAYDALAETRAQAAFGPLLERALEDAYPRSPIRALAPLIDAEHTHRLLREWLAAEDGTRRRRLETVMAAAGVATMQRLLAEAAARADEAGDAAVADAARTARDSVADWRERAEKAYEFGSRIEGLGKEIADRLQMAAERYRARDRERFRDATTEQLASALADDEPHVRTAAAVLLSEQGDPSAAPALVAAVLREPRDHPARQLAGALRAFAPQPLLAAELARMLERFAHVATLDGQLPQPGTEPQEAWARMQAMLARAGVPVDPDASVRATDRGWMVGDNGLRLALVDMAAEVRVFDLARRARAARALAALDPEQALDRLAPLVAGGEEEPPPGMDPSLAQLERSGLAVAAVDALAPTGDPRLAPLLLEGLGKATSGDAGDLVMRLISALAGTGAPEAGRPLMEALLAPASAGAAWKQRTSGDVQQEIHAALQRVADPAALLGWLRDAMAQRPPEERIAAIDEYARWRGEPATLADVAVGDPEARVRSAAASALRWYPGAAPLALLAERLQSAETAVRRASAEALAHMRDESAVPHLRTAFEDPEPEVRLAAAATVAALAEGDAFAAATAVIARDAAACEDEGGAAVAALLLADEAAADELPPAVLRRVALDPRFAGRARDAAWMALERMDASLAAAAVAALEEDRFEAGVHEIDALVGDRSDDDRPTWVRWLLWWRGVAQAELGRLDEAIEDMSGMYWRDAADRAQLAGIMARAGRGEAALSEVAHVLEEAEDAGPLLDAGWAACVAGDPEIARDAYERAVQEARMMEPAEAEQVLAAGRADLDELAERGTADAACIAACRAILRV